jgi:hypothetical protein
MHSARMGAAWSPQAASFHSLRELLVKITLLSNYSPYGTMLQEEASRLVRLAFYCSD